MEVEEELEIQFSSFIEPLLFELNILESKGFRLSPSESESTCIDNKLPD